jgi:hypothetical protein
MTKTINKLRIERLNIIFSYSRTPSSEILAARYENNYPHASSLSESLRFQADFLFGQYSISSFLIAPLLY